jgi:hypothetical protein
VAPLYKVWKQQHFRKLFKLLFCNSSMFLYNKRHYFEIGIVVLSFQFSTIILGKKIYDASTKRVRKYHMSRLTMGSTKSSVFLQGVKRPEWWLITLVHKTINIHIYYLRVAIDIQYHVRRIFFKKEQATILQRFGLLFT